MYNKTPSIKKSQKPKELILIDTRPKRIETLPSLPALPTFSSDSMPEIKSYRLYDPIIITASER